MHTGTLGKKIYEKTRPSTFFTLRHKLIKEKGNLWAKNVLSETFRSKPVQQGSFRPGRSISSLSARLRMCRSLGSPSWPTHTQSLIRNLSHALTGDNYYQQQQRGNAPGAYTCTRRRVYIFRRGTSSTLVLFQKFSSPYQRQRKRAARAHSCPFSVLLQSVNFLLSNPV